MSFSAWFEQKKHKYLLEKLNVDHKRINHRYVYICICSLKPTKKKYQGPTRVIAKNARYETSANFYEPLLSKTRMSDKQSSFWSSRSEKAGTH
jgi:hypothetical protein